MGMKLAISGKGGVGKSTVAAAMALLIAERGDRVLAIDADPDANLAAALGIGVAEQAGIVPVSRQVALIEERTGAKVKQYGQMFRLNPEVSDIADTYAYNLGNVALLVLGAVEQGGNGCACPESILLRALVTDVVLYKRQALIMDMEAGVEHLGRATARGVDCLLVVVEPGQRSIDSARRVVRMAAEIGLTAIRVLANKVMDEADEAFIRKALGDIPWIVSIPYCQALRHADRDGRSVLAGLTAAERAWFEGVLGRLEEEFGA